MVEALLKALPPSERELFERFAPGRPPTPVESGGRTLTAAQRTAQQQAAAARVQLQTMLQQALCARARPAPASRAWNLNTRFPNGTHPDSLSCMLLCTIVMQWRCVPLKAVCFSRGE